MPPIGSPETVISTRLFCSRPPAEALEPNGRLFPKLRARTTLGRDLLDRLDEEHLQGEWLIRDCRFVSE